MESVTATITETIYNLKGNSSLSLSEFKILTWALPCSRVCRKEPNGKMQLISFLVKGSISFYLYCCIYVTAISKQRNIFESLVQGVSYHNE